ncbi:MAG: DUF3426 domain-containing protein [Variovorax sp.]
MSLVTRCPSCATTFKVVRDQLRISDGWVRCGRCSNVFDATLDLQDQSEAPGAPPAQSASGDEGDAEPRGEAAPPAEPDPDPDPEPEAASPPAMPPTQAEHPPLPTWPVVGVVADEPWPAQSATLAAPEAMPLLSQESLASSVEALDDFSAVVDQSTTAQLQKALRRARIEAVKNARARRREAGEPTEKAARRIHASTPMPLVSAASIETPVAHPPADARPPLPAFARPGFAGVSTAAPARASAPVPLDVPVRRRGTRKAALVAAIALGVLLLLVQVLRHERDAIVAQQPSWRPAMETLCKLTGCELAALRRIGDITIDGAAFAREKTGEGYRLDFTLRNGVAIPLAMPAVELTLLDTQERAVVRRVLMPADFGAPPVLAPRTERNVSLPLALSGTEAAALPPVAGYRVVAFYP